MCDSSEKSVLFEVEKILDHKKISKDKYLYLVKWQGYDSSHNTWEPDDNFASQLLLLEYHEKRKKKLKIKKLKEMADKQVDENLVAEEPVDKNCNTTTVNCDFLSEKSIDDNQLIPLKVLDIFHVKDNEKFLVAVVQFKHRDEPAYVPATWANMHCPQMVIALYETRIYWEEKNSGELVKAEI